MFLTKEKDLKEYWDAHKTFRNLLIKEIVNRASEIDPTEEKDWEVMIFGWAIGKGMSIQDADDFASQVSYEIALAHPKSIQEDAIVY